MNMISIFIVYCFCISKTNASFLKKFYTQKGQSNANRSTTLYTSTAASMSACASMCSSDKSCCSADYYEDNKECMIDACCFPPLKANQNSRHITMYPCQDENTTPEDCSDLPLGSDNGVYTIYPRYGNPIQVFCEMRLHCEYRWTVVQRRFDGSVNFYRNWNDYKLGFGDVSTEHWIGNDNLHYLTNSRDYILRFDMEDFSGNTSYAEYTMFKVGDESINYTLTIGSYTGTSGDSMVGTYSLNGTPFTTYDYDNDKLDGPYCMDTRKGAWWHRYCTRSNPNGIYKTSALVAKDSIYWRDWRDLEALKVFSMKIRAK